MIFVVLIGFGLTIILENKEGLNVEQFVPIESSGHNDESSYGVESIVKNQSKINVILIGLIDALLVFFLLFFFYNQEKNRERLMEQYIKELADQNNKFEQSAIDYRVGTKLLVRRDLELSRANEKLKEVDEIKSNFISVAAHQLRTPLSGIKWTLSMLLGGDMGDLNNDQKTFLMKSYESNNRMIKLVNDMLDTDRLQSNKVHYKFRFINLIDLLDNVLFEISSQASKKNISIEFKRKLENLPEVYVDPDTIRAVLQNLLENSIKYTMERGKIVLDVQNKGKELEISISDNGIGIPEDQQRSLFERFFRARNAVKLETDGSGLGLYIAKSIVERNGGKIWFESKENQGSTFYFTIPMEQK